MNKPKIKTPVKPDYGLVMYVQLLCNELIEQLCMLIDKVEELNNREETKENERLLR